MNIKDKIKFVFSAPTKLVSDSEFSETLEQRRLFQFVKEEFPSNPASDVSGVKKDPIDYGAMFDNIEN